MTRRPSTWVDTAIASTLVFDEVHHLGAPGYLSSAASSIAPYRLGLTATWDADAEREDALTEILGEIVYEKTITELSGEFLADYETVRIPVSLSPSEQAEYEEARNQFKQFVAAKRIPLGSSRGWQTFLRHAAQSKAGRAAFKAHQRSRQIAHGTESKLQVLSDLLGREHGRRTVVFTHDNETAYKVSKHFLVPCISHQTDIKERRAILAAFEDGSLPVIVTSRVLNEGVDMPAAEVAIVLSGTGTVREHVQRLGRILRPAKIRPPSSMRSSPPIPQRCEPAPGGVLMMLTGELIRTKTVKKQIVPSFISTTSARHVARAEELVALMSRALESGWTRGQLGQAITEICSVDVDHKITKGMAKLLMDKGTFETQSPQPPAELRWTVFHEAARRGPLALGENTEGRLTAEDVLRDVAERLECDPSDVMGGMYADLKDHQVLAAAKLPKPEAHVHRYNTALVQAILLKASHLKLRLTQPHPKYVRQLLRYLKFYQLMFRARTVGNDIEVEIDGPQSLLSLSTRYGMQLANFFQPSCFRPATGPWRPPCCGVGSESSRR